MIAVDELEDARGDLEALLAEVLASIFGEDAYPVDDPLPGGERVVATLAVADDADGGTLGVRVSAGAVLGRLLAWRMFAAGDPSREDLLDAVGELGNIAAGNVKSLLFHAARLSLPAAEITDGAAVTDGSAGSDGSAPPDGARPATPAPGEVRVSAAVLGQVVELALTPGVRPDASTWPPLTNDEVLETQP